MAEYLVAILTDYVIANLTEYMVANLSEYLAKGRFFLSLCFVARGTARSN